MFIAVSIAYQSFFSKSWLWWGFSGGHTCMWRPWCPGGPWLVASVWCDWGGSAARGPEVAAYPAQPNKPPYWPLSWVACPHQALPINTKLLGSYYLIKEIEMEKMYIVNNEGIQLCTCYHLLLWISICKIFKRRDILEIFSLQYSSIWILYSVQIHTVPIQKYHLSPYQILCCHKEESVRQKRIIRAQLYTQMCPNINVFPLYLIYKYF